MELNSVFVIEEILEPEREIGFLQIPKKENGIWVDSPYPLPFDGQIFLGCIISYQRYEIFLLALAPFSTVFLKKIVWSWLFY